MQVSGLSLNQCDLFWCVIRCVVVGFCSGKGIKIVNAHKKKVLLWGASWRTVSLWPHDACSELHSPGSLQQVMWAAYRCWWALWDWCTNGAILNTITWPWDSGSCSSKVLVVAQLWEPKGRSLQKWTPGQGWSLLECPHETDTEAESKA